MDKHEFEERIEDIKTLMVKLANLGLTGDEIAEMLRLNVEQAEAVHYQLLKAGEIAPAIDLEFNHSRRIKATATGITIPRSRVQRLRLSELFENGKDIRCRAGNRCLIIELVSDIPTIETLLARYTGTQDDDTSLIALPVAGASDQEEVA